MEQLTLLDSRIIIRPKDMSTQSIELSRYREATILLVGDASPHLKAWDRVVYDSEASWISFDFDGIKDAKYFRNCDPILAKIG